MPFLRLAAAAFACVAVVAAAAPMTRAEIAGLCSNAEDSAHCGRLIEEAQLKRLPSLARRDGNSLLISLYPSGTATFTDSDDAVNGRSYSLWNYLDAINAVVLYTTAGDATSFTLLQRTTDRRVELPSEPTLAPDRAHLVTADVCPTRCINEIAVWRLSRDGVRKDLVWSPPATWTDAAATWKDADTLNIEYSEGTTSGATLQRKLSDAGWKRAVP
jgi:hypothetical protein